MITSVGSLGRYLKEHVVLDISICRLGILHCAISMGTGDLCGHGGHDVRIRMSVGEGAMLEKSVERIAAHKNPRRL